MVKSFTLKTRFESLPHSRQLIGWYDQYYGCWLRGNDITILQKYSARYIRIIKCSLLNQVITRFFWHLTALRYIDQLLDSNVLLLLANFKKRIIEYDPHTQRIACMCTYTRRSYDIIVVWPAGIANVNHLQTIYRTRQTPLHCLTISSLYSAAHYSTVLHIA